MRTLVNVAALTVLLIVCCHAKLAEKVSEDDNFVVYRIPVGALDLQTQETGYHDNSYGRSNSKTSSHSKSTSSSTGSGKGRGIGGGSSGEGYGSGSGGGGGGGGGHHYGGGGGHHYGGGQHFGSHSAAGPYHRGSSNYGAGNYEAQGSYDEQETPKIYTTTKTYTSNNHEVEEHPAADAVGNINFRLADYLKDSPGHDAGKYSQKLYEGFAANDFIQGPASLGGGFSEHGGRAFSEPNYRGTPTFNLRDLNRGVPGASAFGGHHSAGFGGFGSPSVLYPRAYAMRHSGFGIGGY